MAKFWLSYITDAEILFQYYHCPRFGNRFDEFFEHMLPLLAACGNIYYSRSLSIYYWQMMTLADDDKNDMSQILFFFIEWEQLQQTSMTSSD